MPFTVQDGLAIVQGIRGIEDNRRAREKEQEGKDIDAYAELLTKRSKLQDPNAIRQIDYQLEGYAAPVKIRGTVQYQAMLKGNQEAQVAKFKTQAMQAFPKMKAAETFFKTGETGRAMQQIDQVMTENLPNGYTYKTIQKEDGKWEQQVYNAKGELTKTNIVTPEGQLSVMQNLMESPGNMFDLYRTENMNREKENWQNMFNFKTYVDKDGNEMYTWGGVTEDGKYHQIFADQNGKPTQIDPKEFASRFKLKKTDKEELEEKKIKAQTTQAEKQGAYYESYTEDKGIKGKKYRDERVSKTAKLIVDAIISPDAVDPDADLKRNKLILALQPIIEHFMDKDGKITNKKAFDKAVREKLKGPEKPKGIAQDPSSVKGNFKGGLGTDIPF